ncbi:hypothetical protein GCM10022631_09440 [Deinococcus rubellus]|uniref:hemopexin repeat-containing protein n=1 Tax=Deinococcus rubellus TaxID=1889240 RepID=UPI0031EE9B94
MKKLTPLLTLALCTLLTPARAQATPFADGIDAAITGMRAFAGYAFFFKGNQYLKYNWDTDAVEPGYPAPIAGNWKGFPEAYTNGIDAAVNGQGNSTGFGYFFKGSGYIKYNWDKDRVEPGYPRPIAGNWKGLPPSFTSGIDAAVNGKTPFNGSVYLFKGNQYVRYNWIQDRVDPGFPQPIAQYWKGLPASFGNGIDEVLNGEGAYRAYAYFFKGNQYARYLWSQDRMDGSDTLPIAGNWRGF